MGVAAAGCTCERCTTDRSFLTASERPALPSGRRALRAVDLFAGCGGMTCGLEEAARRAGRKLDVVLAIELEPLISAVYEANFPKARLATGDVAVVFDGDLGAPNTVTEQLARYATGDVDVLVAGPPCQGHSDLNNHTRREDPKNALYARVARAVEVLGPRLVVIENVPPVQWDKGGVVDTVRTHLEKLGYSVHAEVVDLRYAGVPQTRKRYLLVASKLDAFVPLVELGALQTSWGDHGARSVEWAIADLVGREVEAPFDAPAKSSAENKRRIDYLFDRKVWDLPDHQRPDCHRLKDHSYKSVYGRLWWDKPAPTVTTGFGSMGQGRYVHPSERRTITPHEAARLQTFPDWFTWPTTKRTVLSTVIGNAVPPLLTMTLGERVLAALDDTE
jgi:DNA (cytosine-5)-methyltransferase 1